MKSSKVLVLLLLVCILGLTWFQTKTVNNPDDQKVAKEISSDPRPKELVPNDYRVDSSSEELIAAGEKLLESFPEPKLIELRRLVKAAHQRYDEQLKSYEVLEKKVSGRILASRDVANDPEIKELNVLLNRKLEALKAANLEINKLTSDFTKRLSAAAELYLDESANGFRERVQSMSKSGVGQ